MVAKFSTPAASPTLFERYIQIYSRPSLHEFLREMEIGTGDNSGSCLESQISFDDSRIVLSFFGVATPPFASAS